MHTLLQADVDSDLDSDDQQQQAQRGEAAAAASNGFDNIDRVDEDHLDYTLLAEVVLYAVSSEGEAALQLQAGEHASGSSSGSSNNRLTGAVLVFLPGVLEISKLCRELERGRGGHYLQV
jgi:HrpA-like RNA helicase